MPIENETVARRARILVVDDHPVVRAGVAHLLSDEPDLEVCAEASGVAEAIAALEAVEGDAATCPDLAVVDIMLPDGCGLELVKELRDRSPDLPILVASVHDELLFAERALRAGARGFINKQEAADELLDAIREILSGGTWLSASIRERWERRRGDTGFPADPPSELDLSDRELQVFALIGRGAPTREIAERLDLSIKTVESYREKIKIKLGLDNGNELMRRAVEWSLRQG
jgi:DNA-binding NarL/FixJ family response regulator